MSKPPLIDSGADITTDWINRAFAAGGAGFPAVTQISTVPIGVGRGLVGEILRCRLAYADADPDPPTSVIVKLPGRDRRSRTMSRRLGLHEREYAFYSRLRDDVLVRTPCLYYTDYDAETDGFVIVQEDLTGMVQVDQIGGATAEQARAALHNITMLHAQFLGQTRDERFAARVWTKMSRWELFLFQALYLWFLPSVHRDFGEYLSPPLNRLMIEFGCSMKSFWRRAARLVPLTFTHGDFRLDNLFFDPQDPSRLAVIDWQVCSIGSGMRDVALFLATNVEPDVRRTIERDVIEEYGEAMARAGTDIAFDVWWQAYRMHILGHLYYAVMVCGGLEAETGPARELVRTGLRRTVAAIEELRVGELLHPLETDRPTRMLWSGFHGAARGLTMMRRGR